MSLEEYLEKRDFGRSPEPDSAPTGRLLERISARGGRRDVKGCSPPG